MDELIMELVELLRHGCSEVCVERLYLESLAREGA